MQFSHVALQIDELTDISGKTQLLVFVAIAVDDDISKQFFCCNIAQNIER